MAIWEWKVKASLDVASVKKATNDLKGEMNDAWDNIEKNIGEKGSKWVWRLSKAFGSLKTILFAGWILGALASIWTLLKNSFTEFVAFEKWLARINTVANVSKKEMKGLWQEIQRVAETYGLAKAELLETGFNIASAWVEFQNVSKIMELSAITAVGAGTDTTTAFNGIIAVIKKYGENINIAWDIAEKFFIANKLWQTTIEDMAIAMQNLTSSAKPAGVSINEVFAILSTLTGVTWNANQVITQLNGAINALASPTKEARKLFDKLWIEVWQSAIKQKGFATVAKEVYDAVDWNTEALRQLIPEIEAQKLIIALATTQNTKYKDSLDEVTTGQWNLEEAVRKMADTTDFKLKVAQSKWQNFKTVTWNVLVSIMGWIWDFWRIAKSVFLWTFGLILGAAWISLAWIWHVVWSGLKDVVWNFKEFARVVPQLIKASLNDLPWIMSAWLRAMLGMIPWNLGEKFADKLWLNNFWNVFGGVDTSFNFTNTKSSIKSFQSQMWNLTKWVAKEFGKVKDIITWNSTEQQLAIKQTVEEIEAMNQSFGDDTINKLNSRLDELNWQLRDAKIGTDEYKKLQKQIWEVESQLLDASDGASTLGDVMGSAWETGAKGTNVMKKKVEELEKEYADIEKQIDDNIKAQEEYAKDSKKYNDEILTSIREINKELEERKNKLDEEISNLDSEEKNDLASRYVEIKEREQEIIEQIADTQQQWFDDEDKRLENIKKVNEQINLQEQKVAEITEKTKESSKISLNNKLEELKLKKEMLEAWNGDIEEVERIMALEKEKKKLIEETALIESNVSQEKLKDAERYAKLNSAEKIIEDTSNAKNKAQEEFDAEKAKMESMLKINQAFLWLKKLDEQNLTTFMETEAFNRFSKEEQALIIKLATERIKLTEQSDFIIWEQAKIASKTVELSNQATAVQMSNLNGIQSEYASLIAQIDKAIRKQAQLNSSKSSRWFAVGWFTGDGGANEVAGVVHKGEWVAPKWMVNSMKPLFDNLEGARWKGFVSGWNTSTLNKTQNNTINVAWWMDAKGFLDYANWKL